MKKPILIIEDDYDIRNIISDVLTGEGYSVVQVNSGSEALTLIKKGFEPKLILLDLHMPYMTGEEFLSNLEREHPELNAAVSVLVMTAMGSFTLPANCGPGSLLVKPVDIEVLLSKVARSYGP